MVKKNTCVFISSQGSNLKILLLDQEIYFPIKITLVITIKGAYS